MKARRESLCGYCGGLVTRGMQIGQVVTSDGYESWQHTGCIRKQQESWSDVYHVDPEARKAAETERALAFLRSTGSHIALPVSVSRAVLTAWCRTHARIGGPTRRNARTGTCGRPGTITVSFTHCQCAGATASGIGPGGHLTVSCHQCGATWHRPKHGSRSSQANAP